MNETNYFKYKKYAFNKQTSAKRVKKILLGFTVIERISYSLIDIKKFYDIIADV